MGRERFLIFFYSEVNSTMLKAREIAREVEAPFVVRAARQTKGYGRKGAFWVSPEGGLWFTAVFPVKRLPGLSCFLSLVILKALKGEAPDLRIKWPNDIVYGKRKVAGLLIEVKGKVFWGVGINLNNELPPELKGKAVSLKELTRKDYDPEPILLSLLDRLFSMLSTFEEQGLSPFIPEYEKELVFLGKKIEVIYKENLITGIAHGISDEGFLKLQTPSGQLLLPDGTIVKF
ncbi:MAG: biotin--[acetyl-CoA-carboxylase] ligase [Coprothermobacterota bacterium]|nr:biotin--[acetyl-CoA-carboxylase] ligase [Coprothermobacterota bacterium]